MFVLNINGEGMRNYNLTIFTLTLLCLITSDAFATNPSVFQSYNLKYGVVIKLPKHWQILESQLMNQIDTNTEIYTGIGQGNNQILIAANYYEDRTKVPAASARVSLRIKQTASQSDIAAMSQAQLDAEANQAYQVALAAIIKSGDKITKITPYNMVKDTISGFIAMRSDYQEIKANHISNVSVYLVCLGNKIIKVTLSFNEAKESLLKPTIDEIKNSIQVKE
jgi:hypothetical protein